MVLLRRFIAGFSMLIGCYSIGIAQTATSVADGNWNDPTIWSPPFVPTSTYDFINVVHTITIPTSTSVTIDNLTLASGEVIISNGATLTMDNGAASASDLTFSGGKITVQSGGTFALGNTATHTNSAAGNFIFESGSTYRHLYTTTEGVIPTASWDINSTLRISGYTASISLTSSSWSQAFGNVTYDAPSGVNPIGFQGRLFNIRGTFTVSSGTLTLTNSLATNSTYNFGAISVTGSAVLIFSNFISAPLITAVFDVDGDVNFSSSGTSRLTNNGVAQLRVGGNFTMSAGTLHLCTTGASARGRLYLSGNMNFTGGLIQETGPTFGEIIFEGTGTQTYTRSGSATHTPTVVNYIVNSGSTVNLGTSYVDGSGTLVVNGTLGVGSTDINGAIQSGTTNGNIRLSGVRTFNAGSTVNYNGVGTQYISNVHPSSANTHVTVGTLRTVTGQTATINGDLTLVSGNLQLMANTGLVLGGSLSTTSNTLIVSATSDLTINGTGDFGAIPFPSGVQTLRNLTLNRTTGGLVTLNNALQVNGALTLTNGSLVLGSSLILNGTSSYTGGYLSSDGSTDVSITGTGLLGSLRFEPGFNQINSLTINRSAGAATINDALEVVSAVNLTNGTIVNGGSISLANGVIVTRNSNGQLNGNRFTVNPGNTIDILYTGGSLNTGFEIPVGTDAIANFTVNGGPVLLSESISINNSLILQSGSLDDGGQTISMYGFSWLDDDGDFIPNGGTVDFYSLTTFGGTSIVQLPSINVTSGSEITLPIGPINIAGDINVDIGGIIVSTDASVVLNGSSLQTLSLNGTTLPELTVNKSGGTDVVLTSPLSLTGGLIMQSASDFDSNGHLTLLSTSDAATGNAYVATLPAGASVSGVVTVQRYMSGEGRIYRYLSSPVQTATVADLQDDIPVTGVFVDPSSGSGIISTNASLFEYLESDAGIAANGWYGYPQSGLASANQLFPGKGYSAFVREASLSTVIDFPGVINQGDVDMNITFTDSGNSDDGWNLVGNPYPSSIQWSSGWTKVNIDDGIVIRDNGVGTTFNNFRYWDGSVGDLPSDEIAAGQAFWVRANAASPQLIISEDAKITSAGAFYRTNQEPVDYLRIEMSSTALKDITYIRQRNLARAENDKFDLPKLSNDYFNLSVKTGTSKLAISAVPTFNCDETFQLNIEFVKRANGTYLKNPNGTYSIKANAFGKLTGATISIFDKFTNSSTILVEGSTFSFTINSAQAGSIASDRFTLKLNNTNPYNSAYAADLDVCEGQPVTLLLEGTTPNVGYRIMDANSNLLTETIADSSAVSILLPSGNLNAGVNQLKIMSAGWCSVNLDHEVVVSVSKPGKVKTVTTTTICQSGSAELEAFGGATNSTYQWYYNGNPLAVTEGKFVTPMLSQSTQFEVAVVMNGCEGVRFPISVPVVMNPEPVMLQENSSLISNYESGNQWYLNGVLIDSTNNTIEIDKSGIYKLAVELDGCSSFVEEVLTITGLETEPLKLTASPNPVTDHFQVIGLEGKVLDHYLIDATGKKVPALHSVVNGEVIEVDAGNLLPGLYIMKVYTTSGMANLRVIKL